MAKRVKAGQCKDAVATRRAAFVRAYLSNGLNKTQAAITAGYAPKSADVAGRRLYGNATVKRLIAQATEKAADIAGLSVERTLQEVARLAYSDPRRLYRPDGQLRPVHELDADTAATVASVEVDEIKAGDAGVIGHTVKIKHWDKNAALEKAMKYHALYREDNAQRTPAVIVVTGIDKSI